MNNQLTMEGMLQSILDSDAQFLESQLIVFRRIPIINDDGWKEFIASFIAIPFCPKSRRYIQ